MGITRRPGGGLVMALCMTAAAWAADTDTHWIHDLGLTPPPGGHFGSAVCAHGDYVIAGAPYEGTDPFNPLGPGAARISHVHDEARGSILTAPDGQPGDVFGMAVAIHPVQDSDVILALVGAPRRTGDEGEPFQGAVYVYRSVSNEGFSYVRTLIASDASAQQMFGTSVGFDGQTIAVGASRDSKLDSVAGCVYVYDVRGDGAIGEEQRLDGRSPSADRFFGFSVDIRGDLLAIGAIGDSTGVPLGGLVSLYNKDELGTWRLATELQPPDVASLDLFGTDVAIGDDIIVASSHNRTVGGLSQAGRVYIFAKQTVGWAFTQHLDGESPFPDVSWGVSVAIEGNYLAIGATGWRNAGVATGAVAIYEQNAPGEFDRVQTLCAINTPRGAKFGVAVDLQQQRLLVGAPEFEDASGGAVHHYVPTCLGDLTGDHVADVSDMIAVVDHWGERGLSPGDLDQDGEVDIQDVLVVTGYWGPCQ